MMNKKRIVIFLTIIILSAASFLKLYYIHYTETWQRQHDVIGFGASEGHAYYIEYILNNKSLPDFDPRQVWGFFQPPLHHIISAFILGISETLGFNSHSARENIQAATCLYMILLSVLSVFIYLRANNKSGTGIIITALITGFHPIFILLSGSINNDALALILSLASIALAAYWYDNPTFINTALLALSIGLSMLAKLTGGLLAVPIGILMAVKCFGLDNGQMISLRQRFDYFKEKYILKIILFSVIVFPIGLFWSIRNKLKWDMPFNYIPPVGEVFPDSVSLLGRIFDIRTKSVFPYLLANGYDYDEFNVFLLMIKSSLFGEYSYSGYGRLINLSSVMLFASGIILIVLCIFATVRVMLYKAGTICLKWKLLLFGTYITYLAAYLYFALSSGNFSAGDFRYAAICIIPEAVFLGIYTDYTGSRRFKAASAAVSVVFALSAAATYIMLGLRS